MIDYDHICRVARYRARSLPPSVDWRDLAQEAALRGLMGRKSIDGPMTDLLRKDAIFGSVRTRLFDRVSLLPNTSVVKPTIETILASSPLPLLCLNCKCKLRRGKINGARFAQRYYCSRECSRARIRRSLCIVSGCGKPIRKLLRKNSNRPKTARCEWHAKLYYAEYARTWRARRKPSEERLWAIKSSATKRVWEARKRRMTQ